MKTSDTLIEVVLNSAPSPLLLLTSPSLPHRCRLQVCRSFACWGAPCAGGENWVNGHGAHRSISFAASLPLHVFHISFLFNLFFQLGRWVKTGSLFWDEITTLEMQTRRLTASCPEAKTSISTLGFLSKPEFYNSLCFRWDRICIFFLDWRKREMSVDAAVKTNG